MWTRWCVGMVVLSLFSACAWADMVTIENPSFESPHVDPNAFQALPYVDQWIEKDNDGELSTNTGVFPNPATGGFGGHLANSEGEQIAFLGSEQGNSLEQDLAASYEPGYAYRLTVAVGVSGIFPPSELNSLELAFYYYDGNEPVNIAAKYLRASDLLLFELVDVSLTLPIVSADHAWAGQPIGIAMRSVGPAAGFWDLDHVRVDELLPAVLNVANASFEMPIVDPLMFPALPYVIGWTELDHDLEASTNTGVFPNPAPDSPGHLLHAESNQLAFLGSEEGNGLEQLLQSIYRPGFAYQLTVGVGVSNMFPPSAENSLAVVLYYLDQNQPVDIATQVVPASGYSSAELRDVTVNLEPVEPNDLWAGQPIGVAIRPVGPASGFWDLDHVRVSELVSSLNAIKNPSFESPAIDPNAYPVLPLVGQWTEIDQDIETSTNTGVFLNTPMNSPDHIVNAKGAQIGYLGSEQGNALTQDLPVMYEPGSGYRLTVGVAVSSQFPPGEGNTLDLVMYYQDGNEPVDIVAKAITPAGLSSTEFKDVSVYLPTIQPDQPWAGALVGVALRAAGPAGGFWDLDNVRLGVYNRE